LIKKIQKQVHEDMNQRIIIEYGCSKGCFSKNLLFSSVNCCSTDYCNSSSISSKQNKLILIFIIIYQVIYLLINKS
jgi:hypothetical protein